MAAEVKDPSKTTSDGQRTKPRAELEDMSASYRLLRFFKQAFLSSTTFDAASLDRGGFARISPEDHKREIEHANTRSWKTGVEKREERGRIGQEKGSVASLRTNRNKRDERARADEERVDRSYDREMFDPYKDGSDLRDVIHKDHLREQEVKDWVANQKRGLNESEEPATTARMMADENGRAVPSTNPDAATTGEPSFSPTGHAQPKPREGSSRSTGASHPLTAEDVPIDNAQLGDVSASPNSTTTPYLDHRTLHHLNAKYPRTPFPQRIHARYDTAPKTDNKLLGLDIPAWHDTMRSWTDGPYNPYLAIRPAYANECPLAWALVVAGLLMAVFVLLYFLLSAVWEVGLWRRFRDTPGLFSGDSSRNKTLKRVATQPRAGRKLRVSGKANYNRLLRQYRKARRNETFYGSFGEYKVLVKRLEIEGRRDGEKGRLGMCGVFMGLFGLGFAMAEQEEFDERKSLNERQRADVELSKEKKYGEV